MRRTFPEALVFVVASLTITLVTGVVGMMMTAPSSSAPVPADWLSGTCLDEPFRAPNGVVVGTLARLCFETDAVRPRVELTGVTTSALYTGWLTRAATPRTALADVCDLSDSGAATTPMQPERF